MSAGRAPLSKAHALKMSTKAAAESSVIADATAQAEAANAAKLAAQAAQAGAETAEDNAAAQVALAAAQVALAETARTGAETAETNAENSATASASSASASASSATASAGSATSAANSLAQANALSRVFDTDANGYSGTSANQYYLVTNGAPAGYGFLYLRTGAGPGGVNQNQTVALTPAVQTNALRFPFSIVDTNGNFLPVSTSRGYQYQFGLAECDTILMLGDSHPEARTTLENTGPIVVASQLLPYRFFNPAIGGNTTSDTLEYLRDNRDFISRTTWTYDQFGTTLWGGRNARYAIIEGWTNTNDGAASTEDVRATQWARDVPDIVRKVRAWGAEPVLMSQMSSDTSAESIRQETVVRNLARQLRLQTIDVRTARLDLKVVNGPFTDGQHPGSRTAEIYTLPILKWGQTLPPPSRSIKIYQWRDEFTSPTLKNLVFGDVFQMSRRFQEIPPGHWKLNAANEERFEEKSAEVFSAAQDTVPDRYSQLINGGTISLNDWVLIRLAVPGNAQTLDGVGFEFVGNATAAYILDQYPATPLPTLTFDTVAAMNADLAHPAGRRAMTIGDSTAANNKENVKSGASGSGSWATITSSLRDYSGYLFATKAAMDADLAYVEGTEAKVTGDGTAANNGDYVKSGEPGLGSWVKIPDGVHSPNAVWSPVPITTIGATQIITLGTPELSRCMQGNEIYILLNKTGGQTIASPQVHYSEHARWHPTSFVIGGETYGAELLTTPDCSSLTGWTSINSPTTYAPFDLAFGAPRLPSNYANPITGVIVVDDVNKIGQSFACLTAEDEVMWFRVAVWARYWPKPYIDNTRFSVTSPVHDYRGFPSDQLTVRTGSTTIAADSPIKKTTLNRRRLGVGLSVSASAAPSTFNSYEMQFTEFGVGPYWGRHDFDIAIPKAASGFINLCIYGPDGALEIGTASVKRLRYYANRI